MEWHVRAPFLSAAARPSVVLAVLLGGFGARLVCCTSLRLSLRKCSLTRRLWRWDAPRPVSLTRGFKGHTPFIRPVFATASAASCLCHQVRLGLLRGSIAALRLWHAHTLGATSLQAPGGAGRPLDLGSPLAQGPALDALLAVVFGPATTRPGLLSAPLRFCGRSAGAAGTIAPPLYFAGRGEWGCRWPLLRCGCPAAQRCCRPAPASAGALPRRPWSRW